MSRIVARSRSIERLLWEFHTPGLKRIDPSLERITAFLDAIGNPERNLPPVIHVAGTNGKGSVVAYLKAIAKASGIRAHVFTSPDLVRFNERIVLNHEMIGDDTLHDLLTFVKRKMEAFPLTFFEATSAVAFMAFAAQKADLVLLETGMGGRLDATNMVAKPLVSIITPISLDHQQFLGESIEAVAAEKGGILKPGVPCVVSRQPEAALGVIEEKAQALGAPLYREGREWEVEPFSVGFHYRSDRGEKTLPLPSLAGVHQFHNAGAAVACTDLMQGFKLSEAHVGAGIANAVWPARLQKLTRGPLVDMLPGVEVRLDGGHNPAAGHIVADWLEAREKEWGAVYLMCGMVKTKDARGFLEPIAPYASSLAAVEIPNREASIPPVELAEVARSLGIEAQAASSLKDAYAQVAAVARPGELVLVCGSLYLAGALLNTHG